MCNASGTTISCYRKVNHKSKKDMRKATSPMYAHSNILWGLVNIVTVRNGKELRLFLAATYVHVCAPTVVGNSLRETGTKNGVDRGKLFLPCLTLGISTVLAMELLYNSIDLTTSKKLFKKWKEPAGVSQ